jgi:exonuclease SbcD
VCSTGRSIRPEPGVDETGKDNLRSSERAAFFAALKTAFPHDRINYIYTVTGGGMKILHTSDWHIGHALYGKKRNEEHEKFLAWLCGEIKERNIGALIVSGDVFDTNAPGGAAQKIYYDFLKSLNGTCCKTVIITAGNHDSPSWIEAPSGVLECLNIYTIGLASEPRRHVITMPGEDEAPEAICCAVPYLRKNEMVRMEDDSVSSDEKIAAATAAFYRSVTDEALKLRDSLGKKLPIIATGHLFAQGVTRTEGDGVRELYVGSLGQVGADIFPEELDYVALGHIHGEQSVMGRENIRYCGSPLHMSFSELNKKKYIIEIDSKDLSVEKIEVPVFQSMKTVSGEYAEIMRQLKKLVGEDVWIEVTYTGKEILPSLSADIFAAVKDGQAQILRIRNDAVLSSILEAASEETLDTLKVQEVFLRCIEGNTLSEAHQKELIDCFNEILADVEEAE